MNEIYPKDLELKHENNKCDKNASYLDLQLGVVHTQVYTYGGFVAQTFRYAKARAK